MLCSRGSSVVSPARPTLTQQRPNTFEDTPTYRALRNSSSSFQRLPQPLGIEASSTRQLPRSPWPCPLQAGARPTSLLLALVPPRAERHV